MDGQDWIAEVKQLLHDVDEATLEDMAEPDYFERRYLELEVAMKGLLSVLERRCGQSRT